MAKRSKAHWWERDSTAGLLLAGSALISFVLVNSPAAASFEAILHTSLFDAELANATLRLDILHVINDGLMALFFLYVGLELKRETIEGPLRNPRAAALPIAAAIGGMVAPALTYLFFVQGGDPSYQRGWAIPAATDIAFALGILSLAGKHAPPGLRLFLLALAIVDDLGAIFIIAVFYSSNILGWALGGMAATFGAMLLLNRAGVRGLAFYWALAALLWFLTLLSGVHATIAGVLSAVTIPMRDASGKSPLTSLEHALKPIVILAILPVFALANAGAPIMNLSTAALTHPVLLATGLGLFFGKPLGVAGVVLVAAGFLHRILPAPPLAMVCAGFIAGVGFTMSLFIAA
jgi:NhaA family Na+:H+ antiporter